MKKQNTRELLLDSAFQSFYKHGFQGANIGTILTEVGINKGSMYHFFKSKKALGLAVIKERIEQKLLQKYNCIRRCSSDTQPMYGRTPSRSCFGQLADVRSDNLNKYRLDI